MINNSNETKNMLAGKHRVTVAMLGARMHYAVPRLLHEAGLLERFYTDSYIGNKPWLEWAIKKVPGRLGGRLHSAWLGRKDASLPPELVHSFEWLGIHYALSRKYANSPEETQKIFRTFGDKFGRKVAQQGFGAANIVWGFNNASSMLFEKAKSMGKICILEQTILPYELECDLLVAEQERWLGWQAKVTNKHITSSVSHEEHQEWELANQIIAGSDFVKCGLMQCGVDGSKIAVVPYGVDINKFVTTTNKPVNKDGPLKVLFVGEVGLRKGVPYLLEALAKLGPTVVQARFAGKVSIFAEKLEPFSDVAEFLGVVPRMQMPELYQWADIFVLPSIVEGSATVTYEALLSGLPIITTPNSGSIIRDAIDGFIVPAGDSDALANALRRYFDDRQLLEKHRSNVMNSRERAGLDQYKKNLANLIKNVANNNH